MSLQSEIRSEVLKLLSKGQPFNTMVHAVSVSLPHADKGKIATTIMDMFDQGLLEYGPNFEVEVRADEHESRRQAA